MTKTMFGTLALSLMIAAGPEARADRIDLTNGELATVGVIEHGMEKLRVYLSRTLIVERFAEGEPATDVNGGIEVVYQDKLLREIVKANVRGKIIAVEGSDVASANDVTQLDSTRLYVSFDSMCQETSCAFVFVRPYSDEGGCSYGTCSYVRKFASNSYVLFGVPANPDYEKTSVFSRKGLLKREMMRDTNNVYSSGNYRHAVHLELDEEELRLVVKESLKHPGWE